MKVTVLVDNIEANGYKAEWGLSFYIEYNNTKILLDAGQSNKFLDNAIKLNINLNDIDYGVLSHAHYDHSDGLPMFFDLNKTAPVYLQKQTNENCYKRVLFINKYIGIQKETLSNYKKRIVYVDGNKDLSKGVTIINHSTANLDMIGKKEKMYLKVNGKYIPDDFRHEQSLVIETSKGLIVFNSCSHGGFINIVNEVRNYFGNKKIIAYFGGLHLFNKSDNEVRDIAKKIKQMDIKEIYTGHCTGQKAFDILQETLKDGIRQFRCSATYEFEE